MVFQSNLFLIRLFIQQNQINTENGVQINDVINVNPIGIETFIDVYVGNMK